MPAVKRDEAGAGHSPHAHQPTVGPAPEQRDVLASARPDRLDKSAAWRDLGGHGWRHAGKGGGERHGIERRVLREPVGAVTGHHVGVDNPLGEEVRGGDGGELGAVLDAPNLTSEPRKHRRLVPEAGADLEDAFVTAELERLHHRRHQ
jgi:hypothetical protein